MPPCFKTASQVQPWPRQPWLWFGTRASVGRTRNLLKTLHFQRICPTLACTTPAALRTARNNLGGLRSLTKLFNSIERGPGSASKRTRDRRDRRFQTRRPVPRSPSIPRRVRYPTGQSGRLGCACLYSHSPSLIFTPARADRGAGSHYPCAPPEMDALKFRVPPQLRCVH